VVLIAKKQEKSYKGWIIAGVILLVLIILGSWVMGSYNSLVRMDEGVNQKWANVQSAYQRRADLIPNLVETVKGYRDYEANTLIQITELRSEAGQAKVSIDSATSPAELQAAMGNMNSVLSRLLVIVENYPDLKANENFLSLQDELAGTENRIKVERDNYNAAVRDYNILARRFPTSIIARWFGFEKKEMFAADEGSQNVVKVDFS